MADTINLTIVGDRSCSTTLTYLFYLRQAGLRPKRLWLLDFVPETRRTRLARALMGSRRLGEWWLRRHGKPAPDAAYRDLCRQLQVEAGCPHIDHFANWNPDDYAEHVDRFSAWDYHDAALHRRMEQAGDSAFLYTNGGIVPAGLLGRRGIRILHVHPGIVPEIRGSDCLLWSALTRRRLGASCFYMSPGIDEGALIGQREFDVPRMPALVPWLADGRDTLAYRALLFAFDPHLRARMLLDVLEKHRGGDLRSLPAQAQPAAARPAYLWMHARLRRKVLSEAFL